jgi:ParB family transcriptional regulator, chromosome partitioning protein
MSEHESPRRVGGLGRGLSALLSPSESSSSMTEIPLDEIAPNPRQPRASFDDAALGELAASIRAVGVLQPIVVRKRPGGYQLVMGERRVRAARLAGLDRIPAVVRHADDDGMLRDALIENLQREDLNPIEEAEAFRALIKQAGLTHDEIAERIGRSRPAITNALRLLDLVPTVRERLRSGSLSAAHGRAVAVLAGAEAQERIARRIVADGLSVRATEELVRSLVATGAEKITRRAVASRTERAAGILEVEKRLSDILDTRVRVETGRGGRGRIVVEFAGEEDLGRIAETIFKARSASKLGPAGK